MLMFSVWQLVSHDILDNNISNTTENTDYLAVVHANIKHGPNRTYYKNKLVTDRKRINYTATIIMKETIHYISSWERPIKHVE